MPRFKQISQIQQLISKKELIRNVGIIAHIDHGKTTLADSLLAGAGLLSPAIAGSARVLDFLEEEQKRKITIKTANITLLIKTSGNPYIINLVDTPGHVDFTGKVTRALRVIDGAIVVVDAVEEIMPQTEIVTRQALEERVKPVIFINKVDRLITELQLNEEQIQKKLDHIIGRFNDLIELYAEKPFKKQWKVSASAGNVAFGAALHGWGFTLNIARKKSMKFSDIIDAYTMGEQKRFQKSLPVYEAIFEMAIKKVPNPKEAQAYRIEKIWDGHIDSKIGEALIECSDEGPTVFCVTNVYSNKNGGSVATGRLFSGKVQKGNKLHLMENLAETTVSQVSIDMGSFREEISWISAGNLASLTLTDKINAGETLVDLKHKSDMVPFESISYVSEPVVTLAIEPKNPKDMPILLEALYVLTGEDPSLKVAVDRETGEYLLSGMGELHLEVVINQLKNSSNLEVKLSSPRVVYMESVEKKGIIALAKSPNKLSSFWVQVEPELEEQSKRNKKSAETGSILSVDEHRNVLLDTNGKTEQVSEEVLEAIIAGFEFACKAGPLCGEPIRTLKVNLVDFQVNKSDEFSPVEVMRGIGKAVFGSFLTAQPVLLEPVYKITTTVSSQLASESSRIMSSRRGRVTSFEPKGLLTVVTGLIPVSETFGFSKELRSATSGRAFWQSFVDHWEVMSQKLALQVIGELRQRKGLSPQLPKPEKFLEQ
jgi:elongation factor 2